VRVKLEPSIPRSQRKLTNPEAPSFHAQRARTFANEVFDKSVRGVPLSAQAAATAMCRELRASMLELSRALVGASNAVCTELGSRGWDRQMMEELARQGSSDARERAFNAEFLSTQTSMMFLGMTTEW